MKMHFRTVSTFSKNYFLIVCESSQTLPGLTSGLSCYLELYLDMVTLLLNTIYQCTQNWKGFRQCIREFFTYYFSLNFQNYARNLSYYYVHMIILQSSHPAKPRFYCFLIRQTVYSNIV